MTYKKLSLEISFENFNEDIKPLIREIRPHWDVKNLKTTKMQGGISNFLFGVYYDAEFEDGETDMVLVRIYGKTTVDRDAELTCMSVLATYNLAAKVWAQFTNGCCYQYIHGTVLDEMSVRQPRICTLIINELVKLHSTEVDTGRHKKPCLFGKLRELANELPTNLKNEEKNDQYLREFPSKLNVFQEIEELEAMVVELNCPVTFCHNDVLIKNIIISTNEDRIHLIDFEYANYNYTAYDIANHFNEFAGVDTVDFSLYPDKGFQMNWIRQYLEKLHSYGTHNGHVIDNESSSLGSITSHVDDSEVEHWFRMVNKFSLVSHLLWSIWSIFQEINSLIEFDYFKYGLIRWNEYKTRKKEFLEL